MDPVRFVFGVHFHQPVGNFDHVFEDHLRDVYLPLVERLTAQRFLPFALHMSGPLLEWLEQHAGPYLDTIGRLAADGQVELLLAGFYEPVLASLTRADRLDQIGWMREAIRRRFGVEAAGLWLTGRVGEPQAGRLDAEAAPDRLPHPADLVEPISPRKRRQHRLVESRQQQLDLAVRRQATDRVEVGGGVRLEPLEQRPRDVQREGQEPLRGEPLDQRQVHVPQVVLEDVVEVPYRLVEVHPEDEAYRIHVRWARRGPAPLPSRLSHTAPAPWRPPDRCLAPRPGAPAGPLRGGRRPSPRARWPGRPSAARSATRARRCHRRTSRTR